jgi:hypothetical protein
MLINEAQAGFSRLYNQKFSEYKTVAAGVKLPETGNRSFWSKTV